jgi:hypothetical protein
MKGINDLVKMMIANFISIMISKGTSIQRPVEILEFYEVEGGVEATYKTRPLIGSEKVVVKRGLFFLKEGRWKFGELDYKKTFDEYLAEKAEAEKTIESPVVE